MRNIIVTGTNKESIEEAVEALLNTGKYERSSIPTALNPYTVYLDEVEE